MIQTPNKKGLFSLLSFVCLREYFRIHISSTHTNIPLPIFLKFSKLTSFKIPLIIGVIFSPRLVLFFIKKITYVIYYLFLLLNLFRFSSSFQLNSIGWFWTKFKLIQKNPKQPCQSCICVLFVFFNCISQTKLICFPL